MIPIHWGAFSLAPHDWREPVERLFAAAERDQMDQLIAIPRIGESVTIGELNYPTEKWWRE